MNDKQARGFLEDIIAHPDDNTPRLIFADWLEEHGDGARAEFIRVQIERASLPEWDANHVRLGLRERALLQQHGRKWRGELPRIKGVRWEEFRRGFVATAAFSSFKVFRENASACWGTAPVEAVSVRWPRQREECEGLVPIPGLRELSITGRFVNRGAFGGLADSPFLSTLRVLTVRDCNLGVEGFQELVASPHLGNLTALRVPNNSIGNGGIDALYASVSLTSLTELDLSEEASYGRYGEDPIVDAAGLEMLAAWSGMERMRSLTLSGNEVGRTGLAVLLQSPRCSGLKKLVLRAAGLNNPAMQEFRNAPPELRLDVLDVGENLLGDRGIADLANAPCLRELKVLDLDSCELPQSAARRLAKAPLLGSLRSLNLNHNSFGAEGLLALLNANPACLHTLQMVNNDLGDEGASHLAESPASDSLLKLNLAENDLGNHAAEALMKSNHLPNLLVLRLNDNPISTATCVELTESSLGKRLAILEMEDGEDENDNPF